MHDAYLILCHDNPAQVNALAAHLETAGHDVYIHMDGGSMLHDCIRRTEHIRVLPDPVHVHWACWSVVEATLRLMRAAAGAGMPYRYMHLISGQCLPAMRMERLDAVLDAAAAEGKQFIEVRSIEPDPGYWEDKTKMTRRVKVWYPACMSDKNSPAHRQIWWYTYKWKRLRLCRPGYYLFRPFYYGSQWWSLTGDCVAELLRYAERHPFFTHYFRHCFCADEKFIQTCIMRSSFRDKLAGSNGRYIDWSGRITTSPNVLTQENWQRVRESGCLFARKFASDEEELAAYFSQLQ